MSTDKSVTSPEKNALKQQQIHSLINRKDGQISHKSF
jgi:hypothetical protein